MKKLFITVMIIAGVVPALVASELRYSVEVRDAPIGDLARMLVQMEGKNVVVPGKADTLVTASFGSTTLMEALHSILEANGYGEVERNDIVQISPKEVLEKMGADLELETIPLKYSKSAPVAVQAKSLISDRGSVMVDERTNAITIRDTQQRVDNIRKLVANIDRADRQVLIEAKIVEATEQFTRSVGIQWGVSRTGHSANFGGVNSVGLDDQGRSLIVNTPATNPISGASLVLGSFKGVFTDVQITAAEENGLLSVLSRPTVVTLNNQAASIHSGVKFYVKSPGNVTIGGAASGATAATSNLQEIRAGITLTVTPQITIDNRINLTINVTESQPDFSRPVDGTPSINDNSATTTVLLSDGETTIIGGLFQLQKAKNRNGVPGLNRIPLLGALFSKTSKTRTKKELIIFIRPTIADSGVPTLPVYPEAYEKINTLRPDKPQFAPEPTLPQQ